MKNSKLRRALMLAACAVMLVCLSVGATLAYLQDDTEVVENTFSIGSVTIDLDETKVDLYGDPVDGADPVKANKYKLIPGHNYIKDPTVHVTEGSEECWLFVEVVNEIAAIEADTTIAAQMTANGWTLVADTENIFAYETPVDAREEAKHVVVFEEFTLTGEAEVADYEDAVITIKAYAVQKDGFDTAADAWAATYGVPVAEPTT